MTINLHASHRLRLSHAGTFSFSAAGIERNLSETWFFLGFKRTTGAPTTVGDLTDKYVFNFSDLDSGSFKWNGTATCRAQSKALDIPTFASSALAGDHMFLLVTQGTASPPGSEIAFDGITPLGTLQA